ncbi:hypothetical protein HYV31_00960 [candidate division WWE3 bacterium]|nr:hypothetical protein [candidate division WWE3 bacterium]
MNKKQILEAVVFGGALAGFILWFLFGRVMPLSKNIYKNEMTKSGSNVSDRQGSAKPFVALPMVDTAPPEVSDSVVKELDNYVMGVDATGSEDLSDL